MWDCALCWIFCLHFEYRMHFTQLLVHGYRNITSAHSMERYQTTYVFLHHTIQSELARYTTKDLSNTTCSNKTKTVSSGVLKAVLLRSLLGCDAVSLVKCTTIPSKHVEPLIQQHNVTSHKTWILNPEAVQIVSIFLLECSSYTSSSFS